MESKALKFDNIQQELKSINEKLDILLIKKPKTKKSDEVRKWIKSLFHDRKLLPVHVVYELAKEQGYSRQTIQKVRSEHCPLIRPVTRSGKGWFWEKIEKEKL